MKTIKISEISSHALTEDDGIKLRKIMVEYLSNGENIILDFDNIVLYATPFFNSSVGFVFLTLKGEYESKVKVINLTELGKLTYSHSVENAKHTLETKQSADAIGVITKRTIDNN